MNETIARLPQVFMESEIPEVHEELKALANLSTRFRAASKVSFRYVLRAVEDEVH
jgi:hypothetical protein